MSKICSANTYGVVPWDASNAPLGVPVLDTFETLAEAFAFADELLGEGFTIATVARVIWDPRAEVAVTAGGCLVLEAHAWLAA